MYSLNQFTMRIHYVIKINIVKAVFDKYAMHKMYGLTGNPKVGRKLYGSLFGYGNNGFSVLTNFYMF